MLFTKILKPLVTHWRASGIFVALYLDDGFVVVPGFSDSIETDFSFAKEVSKHVRIDLLRAGFVYNVERSKWDPSTIVEWLGMTRNTKDGKLRVLLRRTDRIIRTVSEIQEAHSITIRKLHTFVGQIISLSPVCGNLTRLMTRNFQMKIAFASDEDDVMVRFGLQ